MQFISPDTDDNNEKPDYKKRLFSGVFLLCGFQIGGFLFGALFGLLFAGAGWVLSEYVWKALSRIDRPHTCKTLKVLIFGIIFGIAAFINIYKQVILSQ